MTMDRFPSPAERAHPVDEENLALYARGDISAREVVRRVLNRIGAHIPESLRKESEAASHMRPPSVAPDLQVAPEAPMTQASADETASMSEDTAMIARGEMGVDEWLRRAALKYGRIPDT